MDLYDLVTSNDSYERILTTFHHATDWEKFEGMRWYQREHDWLEHVARDFNRPLPMVCGMASALSPAVSWHVAKRDLVALLTDPNATVATYRDNHAKALRILRGSDPMSELLGETSQKTWNFFGNLLFPESGEFCTLDRHEWKLYIPGHNDAAQALREQAAKDAYIYRAAVSVMRECAKILAALLNKVQAVTWLSLQPQNWW